jgi:hypothetical protein
VATEIIVTDEFRDWYEALSQGEQDSVSQIVDSLAERGVLLRYPLSSGILGSKHSGMRELRIQHAGEPYRVLYAFDPARQAILLVGGVKTSERNRWYEAAIRRADRLLDNYLRKEWSGR